MTPAKHPVKATETTLSLLEVLKETEGRVTELAKRLDISKSAVHNHLSTLEQHGYVVKEDDHYRLGLKFLDLGGSIRNGLRLFKVAEPEVKQLAEETGELANLMTEELGRGVYLYRSKGMDAVDMDTYIGMRKHLHATALGKAILSCFPEPRVREIIDRHGLPAVTENTITDPAALFEDLENIRQQGFAVDDEEATGGVRCIAAPVTTDDRVLGSISISGPTSRLRGNRFDREIPDKVRSAANVIELNVKYA